MSFIPRCPTPLVSVCLAAPCPFVTARLVSLTWCRQSRTWPYAGDYCQQQEHNSFHSQQSFMPGFKPAWYSSAAPNLQASPAVVPHTLLSVNIRKKDSVCPWRQLPAACSPTRWRRQGRMALRACRGSPPAGSVPHTRLQTHLQPEVAAFSCTGKNVNVLAPSVHAHLLLLHPATTLSTSSSLLVQALLRI